MVVLFCFMSWCLNFFVLLTPYVCFHSFSEVKVQYSQRDVYISHSYERGISHVT